MNGALAEKNKPLSPDMRAAVQQLIAKAHEFVGKVTLVSEPPNAKLLVDGREPLLEPDGTVLLDVGDARGQRDARRIQVDEPPHQRRGRRRSDGARADGAAAARSPRCPRWIPSPDRRPRRRRLQPEPAAPAAPAPSPAKEKPASRTAATSTRAAWIALAAGGAFGVTSGVFWLIGNGKIDKLEKECGNTCSTRRSRRSGVKRMDTLTNVFLVAAGVAAVTSGVLFGIYAAAPTKRSPRAWRSTWGRAASACEGASDAAAVRDGIRARLVLALAACKHDLEPLQSGLVGGKVPAPLRDGGPPPQMGAGRGGGDGGVAGTAGRATTAGCRRDGADRNMCEPCDPLSAGAMQVGLRSCCRGITNDECGLTFARGAALPQPHGSGQARPGRGPAMVGGMQLAGCCRPDGRCGVVAAQLGLGCVARDELPRALGGSVDPSLLQRRVRHRQRLRGHRGQRALLRERRPLRALLRARVPARPRLPARPHLRPHQRRGDGPRAGDLREPARGPDLRPVLLCGDRLRERRVPMIEGKEPYCSRLCRNPTDCPAVCFESSIRSPMSGQLQTFSICEK